VYEQVIIAVAAYLLGMAFAGSFLGRRYMGTVDILLHRLFRRRVTLSQYLYWRYFCGIENPPKPEAMSRLEPVVGLFERILTALKQ